MMEMVSLFAAKTSHWGNTLIPFNAACIKESTRASPASSQDAEWGQVAEGLQLKYFSLQIPSMRYIPESSTEHIINRIFKYFWLCHVKGLRERLPKHLHCQEQVSPTQIMFALRFLGKKPYFCCCLTWSFYRKTS